MKPDGGKTNLAQPPSHLNSAAYLGELRSRCADPVRTPVRAPLASPHGPPIQAATARRDALAHVELIDPLDEFEGLRCALVTRTAKEPANAVQTPRQAIYAL